MIVRKFVLVGLAAAVFYRLAMRMSAGEALAAWAGITLVATLLGALLLRFSSLGRITWKNYLAGYLMPWGFAIGRGRLPVIALVSWLVWNVVAIGTLIAFVLPARTPVEANHVSTTFRTLLFIAWAIDFGGILYMLGMLAKSGGDWMSRVSMTQLKALGVLVAMIAVSYGFWHFHMPGRALLIAGGPTAAIGLSYGAFVAVILIFGRKTNWH